MAIVSSFFKIYHICIIKKHFPQIICKDPVICICRNSLQLQQLHVDKWVDACGNITCNTHKNLQVQCVSRGTRMLTPVSACKVPTIFLLGVRVNDLMIFRRNFHLQNHIELFLIFCTTICRSLIGTWSVIYSAMRNLKENMENRCIFEIS